MFKRLIQQMSQNKIFTHFLLLDCTYTLGVISAWVTQRQAHQVSPLHRLNMNKNTWCHLCIALARHTSTPGVTSAYVNYIQEHLVSPLYWFIQTYKHAQYHLCIALPRHTSIPGVTHSVLLYLDLRVHQVSPLHRLTIHKNTLCYLLCIALSRHTSTPGVTSAQVNYALGVTSVLVYLDIQACQVSPLYCFTQTHKHTRCQLCMGLP